MCLFSHVPKTNTFIWTKLVGILIAPNNYRQVTLPFSENYNEMAKNTNKVKYGKEDAMKLATDSLENDGL